MQAIEGTLDDGRLTLFSPLPTGIHRARVVVLVEDAPAPALPAQELRETPVLAENEFSALSLAAWADDSIDEDVDWEAYFELV